MATLEIVAPIVSIGGLLIGAVGSWLTVRNYYDKKRSEDRDRQRAELEKLQATRQKELDEYALSKQKSYAAERDFGHLLRQYDTLSGNIATIQKFQDHQLDEVEQDIREVKAMLTILLVQAGASESSIAKYLKPHDGNHS